MKKWKASFEKKAALSDVMDAIQDGIVVVNRDYRIIHCNRKTTEWFGPEKSVIGRYCYDVYFGGAEACKERPAYAAFETGHPSVTRQRVIKVSGEKCILEIHAFPIKGTDGSIEFVVENLRDITRRIEQEMLLRDKEELFRSLFEQHVTIMLLIDPKDGTIRDANETACRYYGYSHAEMVKMHIDQINTLSHEQVQEEMHRAEKEGRIFFSFKHRLASGEIRDVEVFSGPVSLHGTSLLYSVIHDVTDRKINERERERLLQELQEAMAKVKTLEGYITICSKCHKIRDDKGYWDLLERYVEEHSHASFSHGICPQCAEAMYGKEDWYREMKDSENASEE